MSLIQHVTALIEEAGTGSVETIMKDCPDHTREQVIRALGNARTDGLLRTVGYAGIPGRKGAKVAIYAPAPKEAPPPRPRVASVWEWAAL